MLKKKISLKKNKDNINLNFGRKIRTDYNNIYNGNSMKDKIFSLYNNSNSNKKVYSLFDQNQNSNSDSIYPLGFSYQTKAYTNKGNTYSSHLFKSTNSRNVISHRKIKNSKQILTKLRKTILKIKNEKKLKESKDDFSHKITTHKLEKNKSKNTVNIDVETQNKNKYKELRFKVHNTIQSNIHPLCNNYINRAHLFNEKILEYYQSEHYINLIKNYQNNFHYKLSVENHPKIKMFTDINSLKKVTQRNKLDFKKCFSEKEQKLILLDPAYYFQKDSPSHFKNINIKKAQKLVDRIQQEEEEKKIRQILSEYIIKKNRPKTRNIKIDIDYSKSNEVRRKENKLISKINKILSQQNIKKLDAKKLESLDLTYITPEESNNEELRDMKKDENYDFFKTYNAHIKNSFSFAKLINKVESEKKIKKKKFSSNIDKNMKNCAIKLNNISKDKDLERNAKERLSIYKIQDKKNKFNIVTKQMLIEQNYEYLSKFDRKQDNKMEKYNYLYEINKNKDESCENKTIKKEKNKDFYDSKEKKLLNLHINKIKLNYKQN